MARLYRFATQQMKSSFGLASAQRFYGAATAAVESDSDSEYEWASYDHYTDRAQRNHRAKATAKVEAAGGEIGRGFQWVIIGEPGAKKHVYAELLSNLLQVPHISMATLVRQQLHPSTSLYRQIEDAVNQGKLVPEDITFGLLSRRLEEGYYKGEKGFILDGIPRTRLQAEILDQIADVDLVLNFKCSDNCLVERHSRGESQAKQSSPLCPNEEAAWKEKLLIYAEQSKPLEDYYRKQKKLLDFEVASAPGETWKGLLAALQLQHVSSPISSHKLTA